MKLHKIVVPLVATTLLFGCFSARPPAISDIRESMVKVRADMEWITEDQIDMNAVRAEAERGCGLYERTATPVSKYCSQSDEWGTCLAKEFLFACLSPKENKNTDEDENADTDENEGGGFWDFLGF